MDYEKFHSEVTDWIHEVNDLVKKYGIENEKLWTGITYSINDMYKKYDNNELVRRQMLMLHDWIYDVMKKNKE